jgi:hypothetical protein
MILFGDEALVGKSGGESGSLKMPRTPGAASEPGAFFDQKDPQNKGESLAVAARYRELHGNDQHSKADLKTVITNAGRNFDDHNFKRDMNNAKRQAGFFNLGTGRDAKLSYYGKQYVDALPNREGAGALKKPKIGGRKKAAVPKRKTDK